MSPKIDDNRPAADQLRDAIFEEHTGETAHAIAQQAQREIAANLLKASELTEALAAQFRGWPGVPADRQWYSLGQICRDLHVAPPTVRAICSAAGIAPTMMVDNTPYFDATGYVAIGRRLRQQEQAQ